MNNIEQYADAIDKTLATKRIADMRGKNLTAAQMAESLNKQGILNARGRSWNKEAVRKLYARTRLQEKKKVLPLQRAPLVRPRIHFALALLCNPLCISMLALAIAIVALIRSL